METVSRVAGGGAGRRPDGERHGAVQRAREGRGARPAARARHHGPPLRRAEAAAGAQGLLRRHCTSPRLL